MKQFGAMGLVVGCLGLLTASAAAEGHGKRHRGGHHGQHAQRQAKMFERTDANSDGRITSAEANSASQERFKKMDANHDGVVDLQEALALHENHRKERAKARGQANSKGEGKAAKGEHAKHRRRGKFAKRLFRRMDADNNGKVTLSEAMAAGQRHFKRMDANSDGEVTRDEMSNRRPKHRGHRKHGKDRRGKK